MTPVQHGSFKINPTSFSSLQENELLHDEDRNKLLHDCSFMVYITIQPLLWADILFLHAILII